MMDVHCIYMYVSMALYTEELLVPISEVSILQLRISKHAESPYMHSVELL